MNILIVGGSGFLGKKLHFFLKKKNINTYSFSRTKLSNKNYFVCDISSKSILQKKLNRLNVNFDYVINLSGQESGDKLEMKRTIIDGNRNLINFFKKKNTTFLFMSSILVYSGSKQILSERGKILPRNDYSFYKIKAENLIKKKCKKFIIFRLGNIYDSNFEKRGIFKNLLKSIISLKKIIFLNTKSSRSYMHLNDFCEAIYKCVINTGNTKINKIYNLSHQNITNMQIIKMFEKVFKVKINYLNMKKDLLLDPVIKINSKKFIKKYNFKFQNNFEAELRKYEKKYF